GFIEARGQGMFDPCAFFYLPQTDAAADPETSIRCGAKRIDPLVFGVGGGIWRYKFKLVPVKARESAGRAHPEIAVRGLRNRLNGIVEGVLGWLPKTGTKGRGNAFISVGRRGRLVAQEKCRRRGGERFGVRNDRQQNGIAILIGLSRKHFHP